MIVLLDSCDSGNLNRLRSVPTSGELCRAIDLTVIGYVCIGCKSDSNSAFNTIHVRTRKRPWPAGHIIMGGFRGGVSWLRIEL